MLIENTNMDGIDMFIFCFFVAFSHTTFHTFLKADLKTSIRIEFCFCQGRDSDTSFTTTRS